MCIVITEKGRSWGKDNLDRNVQFVTELFGGIPQKDIEVFTDVQQKLLQRLEQIKQQLKTEE